MFNTRATRVILAVATALGTILLFSSIAGGCRRETKPDSAVAAAKPSHTSFPSTDCRSCHEDIFKAWSGSHHALAHRTVDAKADADAFVPARETTVNEIGYRLEWKESSPAFTEKRGPQPPETYTAEFGLGHTPLRQYVVPIGG